jgi:hypothetical protein
MLSEVLEITSVAVLATGLGFGLGRRFSPTNSSTSDAPEVEADTLDQEIYQAARDWSVAQGRPEMADLLAAKVRVAWRLRYGSPRQTTRRRWR